MYVHVYETNNDGVKTVFFTTYFYFLMFFYILKVWHMHVTHHMCSSKLYFSNECCLNCWSYLVAVQQN